MVYHLLAFRIYIVFDNVCYILQVKFVKLVTVLVDIEHVYKAYEVSISAPITQDQFFWSY